MSDLEPDPIRRESVSKGIKRKIKTVLNRVNNEISSYASRGKVAAGLASEGYNGGYRDALYDVVSALNGRDPERNGWWNP
jgi:hypothetical protein